MIPDREEFVEDLKGSYATYYDVVPADGETELPLAFRADFHSRGERFFLVKKAKIWAAETNEYVYVYSAPSFTQEDIQACCDYAWGEGLKNVEPHSEHNYSNVHVIFVADEISEGARKAVCSQKQYKSYKMSLHGFSMMKTGYIDLSCAQYGTNKQGHDLEKFFKKLFP